MNLKYVLLFVALVATFSWSSVSIAFDDPPGKLISKSPDSASQYLGAPSLAILANGTYVATHGWRWPKDNIYSTVVFTSEDKGESWKQVSELKGLYCSSVFQCRDALYLMGTTRGWGELVIRRSTDQGNTWTTPTDEKSGLITPGENVHSKPNPMRILNGRLWRSAEMGGGKIRRNLVFSAAQDADLLDAQSWQRSELATIAKDQFGGPGNVLADGNIVLGPSGSLLNVMRVDEAIGSHAAILSVSSDGKKLGLDPKTAFVGLPGGQSKSVIRYDHQTRRYWSLVNEANSPFAVNNVLSLASSSNLQEWKIETTLLQHVDSRRHVFLDSYWCFDGNDIVVVSGTGWGVGHSDCLTFHRFENFRQLKMEDTAPILGESVASKYEHSDFVIDGNNMVIKPMKDGELGFTDWHHRLEGVAKRFAGWEFTQIKSSSRADLTLTAKRQCEIFFATGVERGVVDVSGWTAVQDAAFKYVKKNDSLTLTMMVFKRQVEAGDVVEIPQGNWTGGIALIPSN